MIHLYFEKGGRNTVITTSWVSPPGMLDQLRSFSVIKDNADKGWDDQMTGYFSCCHLQEFKGLFTTSVFWVICFRWPERRTAAFEFTGQAKISHPLLKSQFHTLMDSAQVIWHWLQMSLPNYMQITVQELDFGLLSPHGMGSWLLFIYPCDVCLSGSLSL